MPEWLCFSETWLPGYPVWLDNAKEAALWNNLGAKFLYRLLGQNSLEMGSAQFHELRSIAWEKEVHIVIGCHEIDGNTLYNTMYMDINVHCARPDVLS